MFQDYALFPNLNVYKNIVYGLKNRPGISTEKEVEELIELLGLKEHLNKEDRPALRRAEAKSGTCQNIGHEAENPAPG